MAIPDAELAEWRKEFEIASKMVIDLEKHLTFFYIMFRDSQTLKKLMAYVSSVARFNLGITKLTFLFSDHCRETAATCVEDWWSSDLLHFTAKYPGRQPTVPTGFP